MVEPLALQLTRVQLPPRRVQRGPMRPGDVLHDDPQCPCVPDGPDQGFGRCGAGVGDGRPAGEAVGDVDCMHTQACRSERRVGEFLHRFAVAGV